MTRLALGFVAMVVVTGPAFMPSQHGMAAERAVKRLPTTLNKRPKRIPSDQYEPRTVEGWTVRVNRKLLTDEKELGDQALRLLEFQLYQICRVMPSEPLAKLQLVPIWLGYDEGFAPCAQYHPSKEWLTENGYNPDMAKAVEIGGVRKFLAWTKDQPWMVLHELAHAYHDRVLGFDDPDIKAAYQAAKDAKLYESVLHVNGRKHKAYAIRNDHEYFAEGTEAFFGTNDFYPFVRSELKEYDPRLYELLAKAWHVRKP